MTFRRFMVSPLVVALIGCSPRPDTGPATSTPVAPLTAAAATSAAPSPTSAAAPSAAPAATMTAEEAAGKITTVSPAERELPEAARQTVLDELARAVAKAREETRKPPLRLFGVRPDNLLGKLGLENGDRVETLDDRPLGTDAEAREAFSEARTKNRIALKVQRRGVAMTLVFTVR